MRVGRQGEIPGEYFRDDRFWRLVIRGEGNVGGWYLGCSLRMSSISTKDCVPEEGRLGIA